jgi:chorismate mutase
MTTFENMSQLDILPLKSWTHIQGKQPYIIAGPCSAESEEQMVTTAVALKKLGVHAFRCGIWKPRTRPNGFEGFGKQALPWVKAVKDATGLPVATEVAKPEHIEAALKAGVDILWIGARTTVNPFNVQELADALKGVDVPVLIKNPVNPQLELWIGAIERIHNAGIRKLAVIHRGFSTFQKTKYRNAPLWQIAIELKTKFPEIPIIGDPSHMGGKRNLIYELSQKALDLNYDGLIIESHPDPDNALSDAAQQLTPDALEQVLLALKQRFTYSDNALFINHLEEIRNKIDDIDRELMEVLVARQLLVEELGEYKRENNVTVFQQDRWNEIMQTRGDWAERMNLYPEFITEVFKLVHAESIRKQTEVWEKVVK